MTKIVRPPKAELVAVAEALDQSIQSFLEARRQLGADFGKWEAPVEAWAMSNLMVRNIEAVTALARLDEVLVGAAWSNARSAFEAAVRIIWLLYPPDRFESEARWLGLLKEMSSSYRRLANAPGLPGRTAEKIHEERRLIEDFYDGVVEELPSPYTPVKGVPQIDRALREMQTPEMYWVYIEASQYMHTTMAATKLYRRGLGTKKTLGDFTATSDWVLPLRICWLSLCRGGSFLLDRIGCPHPSPHWSTMERHVDDALSQLANVASVNATS